MKKPIVIIICVAAGLLLIAGVLVAVFSVRENRKFKDAELKSCSVSTGGGMNGGYRNVTLRREKDGSVILEIREKETHEDRERTVTYHADPEAPEQVGELVNRYDLYAASKRPYSDMVVYDGDTTTVSFSYKTGYFSISENQKLNAKMSEGFDAVIRCLNALAVGECETTLEPQTALLYLKSGYTLQFLVDSAFDGKLDGILSKEREVSAFGDSGIVLCTGERPDCADAEPIREGAAGTIVYDTESDAIVILYADHAFDHDVYMLAYLDGYVSYACPLIEEMEGAYRLHLN